MVKKQWVNQGWPADLLEIVTPPALALPPDPQDRFGPKHKRVYAGLQLKRPVSGKLSRVYLRVMYQLAKEKGVPLRYSRTTRVRRSRSCSRFVKDSSPVTSAPQLKRRNCCN